MNEKTTCKICHEDKEDCQHYDLYVNGSEGIWMCNHCLRLTLNFIRNLSSKNFTKKLEQVKQ